MRADVSVDCLSNSAEPIAAGVGHLDLKSCPSSCLSANPSRPPVITATAVCLRFLERDTCQHFHCLSLSVRHSALGLIVHSTLSDVPWFQSNTESFHLLLKRCCYLLYQGWASTVKWGDSFLAKSVKESFGRNASSAQVIVQAKVKSQVLSSLQRQELEYSTCAHQVDTNTIKWILISANIMSTRQKSSFPYRPTMFVFVLFSYLVFNCLKVDNLIQIVYFCIHVYM